MQRAGKRVHLCETKTKAVCITFYFGGWFWYHFCIVGLLIECLKVLWWIVGIRVLFCDWWVSCACGFAGVKHVIGTCKGTSRWNTCKTSNRIKKIATRAATTTIKKIKTIRFLFLQNNSYTKIWKKKSYLTRKKSYF